MLDAGARVFGYRYNGYWQDVGTIQSYWETNMALLDDDPELDLYDKDWVIHTRSEERAPAKVGPTAQVHRSLISHGCVIDGTVVNSVLSPGVRVDVGAVVRDSIVMFDSVIRSGAVVDRAILDKEVVVGPGAIVGDGPDRRPAEQAGAGPAQHRHHGRRQARGHPARRADRAERARSRRTSARPTSRSASSAAASPSSHGRARAGPTITGAGTRRRSRPPERAVDRRRSRGRRRAGRGQRPSTATTDPSAAHPADLRLDSAGHAIRRPGRPERAPGRRRGLARRSGPRRPLERADRDGITSWDLVLDGRRRFDLRVTVILDPSLALICWAHYAPPISDMFRKSYRRLLRWNDEFPFAKFSRRRGRAAAARRRAADRRRPTPTRSAWPSPGSSASPTGCSTSRRTGSGSAAGMPDQPTGSVAQRGASSTGYASRLPELLDPA